ncbi:MAG TPA: M56 family metallopeptidase [Vicinamibacterales bacterium]|jgi:beta-lactamase regulating signal transducer with metallopeptidase domain|nr:M56 family metallopeptidase [Vicinamibacterales bacterium]
MSLSIVEVTSKISLVMAVAAVAAGLMRWRASAASRHLVWTLAVAAVLVLPIGSLSLPSWKVPIRGAAAIDVVDHQPVTSPVAAAGDPVREADARGSASTAGAMRTSWVALFLVAYAAGVGLLLFRLVVAQREVRWLGSRATDISDQGWITLLGGCSARAGVRRPVRLVRSREHAMPMACGVRRPMIVMPMVAEMWDDDRRRAVLLHELAHVARFDCLTQVLAELAVALYWPHPGVWWMTRRLRVERELACDDRVLSSGAQPREYAAHLLELAYSLGGYRAPALAVSMARPRQLEGRMLAMLDATRNRATPTPGHRLLALAIAGVVVVPIAAATIVAAPVAPADQAVTAPAGGQNGPAAPTLGPGTWQLRRSTDGRTVQLTVSESENSFHSTTLPVERLDGLAPLLIAGSGGPARFSLKRDAGTFDFEGTLRSGAGGGTVTFAPSATFPVELARRGFARPTHVQQLALAWGDVGLAFIDEVATEKYARPDLQQLVSAAQHGVGLSYVKELAELGYRLGTVDALIRLRDHGVSPRSIRDLKAQGLDGLTAEDLVRARDHGVSAEYVGGLRALGYAGLSLDALVGARDHGISLDYVRDLRQLGYQLSLADLTRARDHGVSVEYIKDLAQLGYEHLSLNDLVRLRDHGVSSNWLREVESRSAERLSIDELVSLRDHGVKSLAPGPQLHSWDLRSKLGAWLARLLN